MIILSGCVRVETHASYHSVGKRRQASRNITAAAVSADTTTDLKQLFQDALKTPQKQGGISTPQATTSAPARPQGLDTSKVPAPSNPDQGKQLLSPHSLVSPCSAVHPQHNYVVAQLCHDMQMAEWLAWQLNCLVCP